MASELWADRTSLFIQNGQIGVTDRTRCEQLTQNHPSGFFFSSRYFRYFIAVRDALNAKETALRYTRINIRESNALEFCYTLHYVAIWCSLLSAWTAVGSDYIAVRVCCALKFENLNPTDLNGRIWYMKDMMLFWKRKSTSVQAPYEITCKITW